LRNTADLSHGLEWMDGHMKVVIRYDNPYLDLKIYPDLQNILEIIEFNVLIDDGMSIYFDNMIGNGFGSGYQNQGYGTLLVSIVIDSLKLIHSKASYKNTVIRGELAPIEHPEGDDETALECHLRRVHFWEKFGFEIPNPIAYRSPIRAKLADLIERQVEIRYKTEYLTRVKESLSKIIHDYDWQ